MSSDSQRELEIKITGKADVAVQAAGAAAGGLDQVAKSSHAAGKAAGDTAKEGKAAAKGLNELGEAGEKGAAAGRNLAAVLQGDIGALAMLGTQLKAVGAVVRANPIGAALVGLTAGLALLPTVIAKFRGVAEAEKEAGDEAANAATKVDAFGDALKKAGEAKIEALGRALAATKEEAKGAADELERVLGLIARVNQAKGMSEQESVDAQRKNDDLKLGLQLDGARDLAANLRGQAAGTGAEAAAAAARAKETENVRAALLEEKRALEIERDQLAERLRATDGPQGPDLADVRRGAEIEDRLAGIAGNTPEVRTILAQRERAKALQAQAEAADKAAAEAEERVRLIGRGVVGQRADRSAIVDPSVAVARGLEDRNRRKAAGIVDTFEPSTAPRVEDTARKAPVMIDGRSMAAESEKTGRQIADEMVAAIRENNARLRASFQEQLKATLPRQ